MAAFAFQNVVQSIGYIRLDSAVAEKERDDALLLDAACLQTGSQIAVVYAYQAELSELKAIAARSSLTTRVKNAGVTVNSAMSTWIEALEAPVQGSPADGAFFEKFPEVFQYHLKRLAVLPLRAGDELLGLLTLGRSEEDAFDPAAVAAGQRAARLLTAVLERDALRRKLAERKVMERAKGILQNRRHLTEEQAYLLLRNNSRRRRVTMAEIAREIIEAHTQRQTLNRLVAS